MAQALERVKRELGPDAVILSACTIAEAGPGQPAGSDRVEIRAAAPPPAGSTAVLDRPDRGSVITDGQGKRGASPRGRQQSVVPVVSSPRRTASPRPARRAAARKNTNAPVGAGRDVDSTPELLPDERILYQRLVENEVAEDLARRIARRAMELAATDPDGGRAALCSALSRILSEMMPGANGIDLSRGGQRRVALVGPPGSGKTTTIAKLAAHLKLRLAKRVIILSMDMIRLAAHEQIRRYGEIIGVPVFEVQTINGARSVLSSVSDFDVILMDTPGLGPKDKGWLSRVGSLLEAIQPHEIHLTLPASLTASAQARHAALFSPLGISHLVLTRLDETVGIGVILNAVERLGWAVSYVTDGQVVPNDIREACSLPIVELILEKVA